MKAIWIILLILLGLFVVYSFTSLFICSLKNKKKWIKKICYWNKKICFKVCNWKNIKNFYKEFYKSFFYIMISGIVLLFLYSVLTDYFSYGLSNKTNINKTIAYFLPQKDTINCLTLKADYFYLITPNKDTFNLKKYNQVPQDTAKRTIFIINSDNKYGKSDSINNQKTNNSETIVSKKSDAEDLRDKILNDTSNIISHTSNLLTYITIFFAIIGILGGIGIYRYLTTVNKLEKETENLKNKTLDAGLTTISAVPLVEATQITSDEYNLAIETITNSIVENRDNINENPKYGKLLIVEALHYWNLRDYDYAVNILKEACKLTYQGIGKGVTIKIIHYHLARIYKQKYFENRDMKDKTEAINWSYKMDESYGKVIQMSLYLIDNDLDNLKKLILNHINKKNHINKRNINEIIKAYVDDNDQLELSDFASMTAMPTILIKELYENTNIKSSFQDTITKCNKKLQNLYESEINNWKGANVKASWYRTMYKFTKDNKYKQLFNTYKNIAKEKGIKYLFDCDNLAEMDIDEIKI